MRKVLGGIVVLGLSIVIPASFSAPVFVYVIWVVIGVAAAGFVLLSAPISERIPWRLTRKDAATEKLFIRALYLYLLRNDLQKWLRHLNDNLDKPTPAELRAFADNLAERLRSEGYAITAKRAEVHLPDNADAAAIQKRRFALREQMIRLLLWDEYE
jgi:hypothetical protein